MKNKDLRVLNDCVDSRNGKRFAKGDYFDPIPTGEQARRLVAATCLPEGAIKLAEAEDAKLAEKADKEEALAEKRAAREQKIAAAVDIKTRAELQLDEANKALADASTEAEKTAAAEKVKEAEKAVTDATEALDKAQK